MQDLLESKLDKLGRICPAPPGRTSVVFVDDLNMPALEKYGAQPLIELCARSRRAASTTSRSSSSRRCRTRRSSRRAGAGRRAQPVTPASSATSTCCGCRSSEESMQPSSCDPRRLPGHPRGEPAALASLRRGDDGIYRDEARDAAGRPQSHYTFNLRDISKGRGSADPPPGARRRRLLGCGPRDPARLLRPPHLAPTAAGSHKMATVLGQRREWAEDDSLAPLRGPHERVEGRRRAPTRRRVKSGEVCRLPRRLQPRTTKPMNLVFFPTRAATSRDLARDHPAAAARSSSASAARGGSRSCDWRRRCGSSRAHDRDHAHPT